MTMETMNKEKDRDLEKVACDLAEWLVDHDDRLSEIEGLLLSFTTLTEDQESVSGGMVSQYLCSIWKLLSREIEAIRAKTPVLEDLLDEDTIERWLLAGGRVNA